MSKKIVKDEILKDEILKDEIMLDDAVKDEILVDDPLKDEDEDEAKDELKQKPKIVGKKEVAFTKNQIVRSKKYAKHRDILQSELADATMYTHTEIMSTIEKFKKGGV